MQEKLITALLTSKVFKVTDVAMSRKISVAATPSPSPARNVNSTPRRLP